MRAVTPLPHRHAIHADRVEHGKVFEHHADLMVMLGVAWMRWVDAPMALEHFEERMRQAAGLCDFDVLILAPLPNPLPVPIPVLVLAPILVRIRVLVLIIILILILILVNTRTNTNANN